MFISGSQPGQTDGRVPDPHQHVIASKCDMKRGLTGALPCAGEREHGPAGALPGQHPQHPAADERDAGGDEPDATPPRPSQRGAGQQLPAQGWHPAPVHGHAAPHGSHATRCLLPQPTRLCRMTHVMTHTMTMRAAHAPECLPPFRDPVALEQVLWWYFGSASKPHRASLSLLVSAV